MSSVSPPKKKTNQHDQDEQESSYDGPYCMLFPFHWPYLSSCGPLMISWNRPGIMLIKSRWYADLYVHPITKSCFYPFNLHFHMPNIAHIIIALPSSSSISSMGASALRQSKSSPASVWSRFSKSWSGTGAWEVLACNTGDGMGMDFLLRNFTLREVFNHWKIMLRDLTLKVIFSDVSSHVRLVPQLDEWNTPWDEIKFITMKIYLLILNILIQSYTWDQHGILM